MINYLKKTEGEEFGLHLDEAIYNKTRVFLCIGLVMWVGVCTDDAVSLSGCYRGLQAFN